MNPEPSKKPRAPENPLSVCNATILRVLRASPKRLVIREIYEAVIANGSYYSQNGIGTRLPGLKLAGVVECNYRKGTNEKEWGPARKPVQPELIPTAGQQTGGR